MRQYSLPERFPRTVLKEAEKVAKLPAGRRLDLRRKFVFTCDPATARDFDDALSLEKDSEGRRVLGVHIADVSHYVRQGSALDREAAKRSTSVYLVDKVVPMLPETLCDGICSLLPHQDRLAFSAFLTFDAEGRCVKRSFAKTLIRSKARFTYEQVMAAIEGRRRKADDEDGSVWTLKPQVRRLLREVSRLAQQLRRNRFAQGALDMEVPEVEILLDANGEMTGLASRPYDESHQMVEECMVAANSAVAQELWTKGIKILARLHEPPAPEKIAELKDNLRLLGLDSKRIDPGRPESVAEFLSSVRSHPLAGMLNVMVLRSLKRACYSARAMGHFGLAKRYYAHFTSPIRRYPDLVLHRQLAAYLEGGGRMDQRALDSIAEHCSAQEQNADEAERALDEIKKFRYLAAAARKGSGAPAYDAVVGRVASFGLFVDVPEMAVGGLVHVSRLSRRYVRYDSYRGALVAGGESWKLGDRIKVRVLSVDFKNRWVDFTPA